MIKFLSLFLSLLVTVFGSGFGNFFLFDIFNKLIDVPSPVTNTVNELAEYESVKSADFYVSPNGNDGSDGSIDTPFLTVERAKQAVRELDKTGKDEVVVGIMAGDYRASDITFYPNDSGTEDCPIRYCKYGSGEVIFNGGVSLAADDFTKVTDPAVLSRLSDEAKENVLYVDLGKYGITKEDYGKIHAIGQYHTADQYDGDWTGAIYSEVFFNDERMSFAQYPDKGAGYLYTEEVVKVGDGKENGSSVNENWGTARNPESDIYRVNQALADRINSWETLDDVWMFGWFKYDWADASTPVGFFNYEERTLSPKFVSIYGADENCPYYFFNVFEELTAPGEFYLDRENGFLYIYPTSDIENAKIDMSLTTDNIISLNNANHIYFEGITFKGTRENAIKLRGNSNKISHCTVKNVAEYAIVSYGYDNVFEYNEITRTGRGGLEIDGGDTETLKAGNNRVENNLIHDWSEIYQTYCPAVRFYGVGNICANNEMYNSPNMAIFYNGNNHIIEYNIIHDVCLLTNDGGAIYSGRRWDWYGNIIRYNYIYDLGSTVTTADKSVTYKPSAIYFDDNLAGQTAYGNILVNIPFCGFLVGSGRDNNIYNNIIINSPRPVHFDNRARLNIRNYGVYSHFEYMYGKLMESPWQTQAWQEAYPQMKNFTFDYSDPDNINLPTNAANSRVTGNLIIDSGESRVFVEDDVSLFVTVENNYMAGKFLMYNLFNDPEKGDYTFKSIQNVRKFIPDFEDIPFDKIGINK